MMVYKIKPKDFPCKLGEMEPGLFLFEGTFGLKADYANEYFICDGGSAFWGGTSSNEERDQLIVTPVEIVQVPDFDKE